MPVLPPQGPQFLQNEAPSVRIFSLSRDESEWEPEYSGSEKDARAWLGAQSREGWPNYLVLNETSHVQTAEEFMNT